MTWAQHVKSSLQMFLLSGLSKLCYNHSLLSPFWLRGQQVNLHCIASLHGSGQTKPCGNKIDLLKHSAACPEPCSGAMQNLTHSEHKNMTPCILQSALYLHAGPCRTPTDCALKLLAFPAFA